MHHEKKERKKRKRSWLRVRWRTLFCLTALIFPETRKAAFENYSSPNKEA